MKNLKTQILAKLSLMTIIITAFGIIINNIYLGMYNISDFNILQSRSIFIGFVFTIFLTAHLIYYLALIDVKNILNNSFFEIAYKTFFKIILISNLLFFVLNIDIIASNFNNHNNSVLDKVLPPFGFFSCIFIFGLFGISYDIYKTDPKHRSIKWTFKYPVALLVIIGCFSFFYNFHSFTEFKSILYFEANIAFFIFITLTYMYAYSKDASKGIFFKDASFFTESDRDSEFWLEKISLFAYVIVMSSVLLFMYSYKIYPNLSVNFGGGEPNNIELEYEKEIISGKLIYQDVQTYYVLKDSSILFIKKDEVSKLFVNTPMYLNLNKEEIADSIVHKSDTLNN